MGQLTSKSTRANSFGEVAVSFAANREDGAQVGEFFGASPQTACVPLDQGGSPLADRKHLLMTVPIDRVFFGPSGLTTTSGYRMRGAGRGANLAMAPKIALYSNRGQFLRSQYTHLALLPDVAFCVAFTGSAELVMSLEVS